MLGKSELKEKIKITKDKVECPIKGCDRFVTRQRKYFKREKLFQCQTHKIFISPSTFEYLNELDNMLWKNHEDMELFQKISGSKRESRIARDNSEDAVTWNVFRFLERNGMINDFMEMVAPSGQGRAEVLYWSFSQSEGNAWSELRKARQEFEMVPEKGTEPDIIIKNNKYLFFVEAKLDSGSKTIPRNTRVLERYERAGEGWFSKVFKSDIRVVALKEKLYELMRLWLLGTWISQNMNLNFYLVNLIRSNKMFGTDFHAHIIENEGRRFAETSWEEIYKLISLDKTVTKEKDIILEYFRNKTLGYDRKGELRHAFSLP